MFKFTGTYPYETNIPYIFLSQIQVPVFRKLTCVHRTIANKIIRTTTKLLTNSSTICMEQEGPSVAD